MATPRGAPKLRRLDYDEVLALLSAKTYRVCLASAEVTGPKGRVIKPFFRDGRGFVRLYGFGGVKVLPRARLVWMSATGQSPPAGFEVHHDDEDCQNDAWGNLICLHRLDHRKQHARKAGDPDDIPF